MDVYTLDASVFVSASRPGEPGHLASTQLLQVIAERDYPVVVPSLLLPEVCGALARGGYTEVETARIADSLAGQPYLMLEGLDAAAARRAARVAAQYRLRGADAVYVAVALRYGTTLVTLDAQQLDRAAGVVPALTPSEALARLADE